MPKSQALEGLRKYLSKQVEAINKVVIEETPLYQLLGPMWDTTPGFFIVRPKIGGNKRVWASNVQRHLEAFSDPLQNVGEGVHNPEIVYQSEHRYSYNYQDGQVGVIPNKGLVEIEENHPNRDMVIQGLLRLLFVSPPAQRKEKPASVNITVNT